MNLLYSAVSISIIKGNRHASLVIILYGKFLCNLMSCCHLLLIVLGKAEILIELGDLYIQVKYNKAVHIGTLKSNHVYSIEVIV